MEAPTFTNARRELYTQLSRYTFGKVVRCTVPLDGQMRVGDQVTVTYFHGLATKLEHRPLAPGSRPTKLWFKKPPPDAQQRPLILGPLQLDAADDQYVPRPGDVIMGNVVPSDGARRNPKEPRDSRDGAGVPESNDRFTFWHPHAACLEYLLNFLYNGTALPELQLAHELRSRRKGAEDDVWAVARLILFGNVAAFAQQHVEPDAVKRPMRLSVPPLEFVWKCATKLDDDSIWAKFVELVPGAQPPVPAPSVEPECIKPAPLIIPPLFGPGDEPPVRPSAPTAFVGRARRAKADTSTFSPPPPPPPALGSASYSHFDAYSPDSPSYYPPPPSHPVPPHPVPHSVPHYSPPPHSPYHYGSYTPQSPPHHPTYQQQHPTPPPPPIASFFHTPPYEPRSPLYSPSNSPPYCPTTPPGEFDDPSPPPAPVPAVNADSVLRLLQRVSSIQSAQAHAGSFSPPHS